jgi:hypothetical protein
VIRSLAGGLRGLEAENVSLPGCKLNSALWLHSQPGSQVWAISGFAPTGVTTIPARSSLEETSLGELLPGSILSDSLKQRFSQGQRAYHGYRKACVCVFEVGR